MLSNILNKEIILVVFLVSELPVMFAGQVLGKMPELAESTPEEDSKADASNSASLYKVTSSAEF